MINLHSYACELYWIAPSVLEVSYFIARLSASKHLTRILFKLRHTSVKHRRKASPSVSYTLRLHHHPISPGENEPSPNSHKHVVFSCFFSAIHPQLPSQIFVAALLFSFQLRTSLDDNSTPVQPNVQPTRRNEPQPPGHGRQVDFP